MQNFVQCVLDISDQFHKDYSKTQTIPMYMYYSTNLCIYVHMYMYDARWYKTQNGYVHACTRPLHHIHSSMRDCILHCCFSVPVKKIRYLLLYMYIHDIYMFKTNLKPAAGFRAVRETVLKPCSLIKAVKKQ